MAVIVERRVVCDVRGCGESRGLKKWSLVDPDGERRRPLLCPEHAKPLKALWKALDAASEPRKRFRVYEDLDEIPIA
jgi:hypothetical protein